MVKKQIDENSKCLALKDTELNVFRWGMREALARKNSSNIWGNSFLFQSSEEQIEKAFKKLNKLNNFQNLFSYIERECSKYGRAIITLNKSKTGDILFNVVPPFFFTGIGKVFWTPQLVVVYQKFQIDNKNIILKSTYNTKKVINEFYSLGQNNELLVLDSTAEIEEYLQIQPSWEHNLGFVPVAEITNQSFYNFNFNVFDYISCADWFPAQQYEELAYRAFVDLEKELFFNHSRIIGTEATQQLIQKWTENTSGRFEVGDFLLETDNGTEIKIQNGMGDFTKYTSVLDSIFDIYFKMSGGSRFSEGGGAQKTVAETSSIRSQMIETTNQKIKLREVQIKDLITKALAIVGVLDYFEVDKNTFEFKINGNILKDDTQYVDNQLKKIEVGVITPIDMIMEQYNVNESEAKKIYEKNKKFMEENMEILNGLGLDDDNKQEGEINETGEHKQANKKGEA